MGTEFGNLVKGFVNDLEKRESIQTQQKNREKVVTYRCEASGIDMAVTRVLNGKDTRTLAIIMSQEDENGKPLVLMKEKDKVFEVSEKSLQSFLDGKDLDTHPISTGCTAIPKLRKGKEFLNILWSFIHSPNCVKLAKMGVIDTEVLFSMGTDRYSSGISKLWYAGSSNTYDSPILGINRMKQENFDNVHIKMVKFAIEHMMKNFGTTYSGALKYIYNENGETDRNDYYGYGRNRNPNEINNGQKYITNKAMKFFIILANRYDEPFALQCMQEYYDDLNLLGVSDEELMKLLAIPNERLMINKSTYSGVSLDRITNGMEPINLLRGRCKMIEDRCVNFEKRRLWEYILNATCVGRGRHLENYLSDWKDYIMMTLAVDKKVRDKYPEHVQVAHDIISEKYDYVKTSVEEMKLMEVTEIPALICDVNTMDYQFRVLRSPNAFCEEASQNSNCVASYITRCAAGSTIVGSFRPRDDECTELTVEVSPDTYKFIQIKGKFNREATEKEMTELMKIQKKVLRRHEKYLAFGKDALIKDEKKTLEDFNDEGEEDVKASD